MKARATIRLTLPSEAAADAVARALEPENAGFVTQRVEGRVIIGESEADATGGLLHTLDDYVACFTAAEKAAHAGRQRDDRA